MAEAATAAIITGAATAAGAPLAKFVLQELKSKIEKHTSLADMHKALNDGLEMLLALLNDKEREVSRDVVQKDTTTAYLLWKNRVSDIKKEVVSLNTKYEQVRANRWQLLVQNGDLKREIKRALRDLIKLLAEECPKEILVDKLLERVIKEIGVPSIVEYPTLHKAFQDIQALLGFNGVKCVALRGQKGVGKTTIMQNLNNHHFNDYSPDNKFDIVIFIKMAVDGQTKDSHILQKIANRMGVDREGDELEVAGRIHRVLKDKRYLLILDGVRHPIDGIWKKMDISKDNDGKVVITTCYPLAWKSACVQRVVELKKLSHTEEWQMFRDIVGDNLLPDIPNARLVCKRFSCCLPLLIDPIARSFKYQESPTDWGTPCPQDGVDGLKEIYSILKICYERLVEESKQKCFLYASLYPVNRNIHTHYLVECYIVQGFLGDVDANTKYSEMRSRAKDVILRHLVNVAFLEEGEQMRYVKMTDLYRQLALYISSKDPNSECKIYVDNEEHKEAFRSTSWKDAKWVSMVDSRRDSLPTSQNYGSLQTLLLQKNLRLVEIPTTYFDSMGNLLVLNLNGTKISRLPSLLRLTSLKAFYLNDCSDLVISSSDIQTLQHLEVFDIRGTQVDFVPSLEHLRCLRISYTASISDCYHRISTLPKLEELNIEVEMQFQQQWSIVKDHIKQIAAQRNITFICDFK